MHAPYRAHEKAPGFPGACVISFEMWLEDQPPQQAAGAPASQQSPQPQLPSQSSHEHSSHEHAAAASAVPLAVASAVAQALVSQAQESHAQSLPHSQQSQSSHEHASPHSQQTHASARTAVVSAPGVDSPKTAAVPIVSTAAVVMISFKIMMNLHRIAPT